MRNELMEAEEIMEEMPGESKGMAPDEVCVPLKALAQPNDAEEMQTPEVGDNGTMTVDYVLTRIEGENAYLKPMSVNGTDLAAEKSKKPEEPDIAEGNALRAEASQMSKYA